MADNNPTDDDNLSPEDEFQKLLRDLLSGKPVEGFPEGMAIDPAQFASAAGIPNDPAALAALFSNLQNAMNAADDSIDWSLSLNNAKSIALPTTREITAEERTSLDQELQVAALWLSEATDITELAEAPRLLTRTEWITRTMPTWSALAEPVALSIANALTDAMQENAPEEIQAALGGASKLIRNIGGALFATQLGQVVGQLSQEVVSGGDIGVPLIEHDIATLLPQNIADFADGLDVSIDQVRLYLAVRELAHARLFRHAKWLRLHLISAITDYARGIHIDMNSLEEFASDFDPSNSEELRQALTTGAFIPEKTEAQLAAHVRLESMLALIEGWVDVVTAAATSRLPRAAAIAETVRRRRATGGPAESAFSTLVGLELRPRRLREAAAMWARVTELGGASVRDDLWDHPDILPTSEEIDNPDLLLMRLGLIDGNADSADKDEFEQALADLLSDTDTTRPVEDDHGGIISRDDGPEEEK
ncbi:zinc-dependent metalloprotease [Lysinibacter sp. HNR]|uniref:zinc-dependent metalloprotease n=1 Tax=Lysinibacter sp. HNR TaxID=3031408 RepID=UPI0024354026|nr:zinc-dependent metalloprotease [Lysinibacter sp. HNR]WGD38381.1 zinc-dependent metalloprotease [Lysinibacter sp. HNR]